MPADDAGVASATVNVAQQIGGSIGTALLNTIATSAAAGTSRRTRPAAPPTLLAHAAMHSYVVAFWIGAAVLIGAALVVGPLLRPGLADLSGQDGLGVPVPA